MMKNSNKVFTVCTVLFSVCLFSFCKKSSDQGVIPPPNNPPPDTSTYKVVWSDEFDEAAIDPNVWNFETGTGTDGWGNHEQEYYQQQNAGIENGNLVITAKKETVGSNHYTSARMTTQGKKEFTYGKIEARIKLPVGQGFWPAFWMLGSNISTLGWPVCGETDIMEHINTDSTIYGTLHWNNNGHVQDGGNTNSSPSSYHVYSVEWTVQSIKFYIDSVEYHETLLNSGGMNAFHNPFFILLNFAVGGGWPGQTIDENLLPAKMYVDYVRVYQKK